jgi:hypothetical protein
VEIILVGWRPTRFLPFYCPTGMSRAVVAALAPVCADKFRALPDAEAKTIALSKVEAWKAWGGVPQGLRDPPG